MKYCFARKKSFWSFFRFSRIINVKKTITGICFLNFFSSTKIKFLFLSFCRIQKLCIFCHFNWQKIHIISYFSIYFETKFPGG
eukprot:UN27181